MSVRQYIGARYVTKIYENSLVPGSAEWEAGVTYEPLTLVTYNNSSYLSKKEVPGSVGNPALNTSYWAVTGAYNGQIMQLQNDIQAIHDGFVTPEMFGAVGDGITDDTAAIQAAINSGSNMVIMDGNYLVTADAVTPHHTLEVPSNIIIAGHGTITLASNNYTNYDIFHINNKSNIIIDGLTLIGDLDSHTDTGGEWGFGINVNDSTDILLTNLDVSKFWGDGIYIGHFSDDGVLVTMTARVKLDHSHIHHNRRNNVTIICGDGCIVDGCELDNAGGTAPQSGIDLEPDNNTEIISNFILSNCYIHDNIGPQIEINKTTPNNVLNVCVHDNIIIGDIGIYGFETGGTTANSFEICNNFIKAKVILTGQNFSAHIMDNYMYVLTGENEPPIKITNNVAVFQNNYIDGQTSFNTIIEISSSAYSVIKGNTIGANAQYGVKIHVDSTVSELTIKDNIVTKDAMVCSGFVALGSTSNIYITNNYISKVNSPAYFVTLDAGVSSSGELISFNTVNVATALSNDTVNNVANIINDVFTP